MFKLVAALSALVAVASAGVITPVVGISGISHSSRVQSHIPIGVAKSVVPVLGVHKGLVATPLVGLGHGHGLVGSHVVGLHSGLGHGKSLVSTQVVGVHKGVGLVGTGLHGVGVIG